MVAAVIGMARALDSTVTAQGVETDAQLAALRGLGCERAQGFLLARPMPEEELFTLLG
jgi:EAL domain-containing protein (putative c-di-GMP-specific phosphodiesterase class I)